MGISEIKHILLVDADNDNLLSMSRQLEQYSDLQFQVLQANNLKEALSSLDKFTPSAIVSGLDLPDSKGKQTIAAYQKRLKGIPLIIVSQQSQEITDNSFPTAINSQLLKDDLANNILAQELKRLIEINERDDSTEFDGKRILVVDDDPTSRFVLRNHLKGFGCIIDEAQDGFIALAMLRKNFIKKCPYDLVVADLMMPNMDGFEFLSTLRARSWGKGLSLLVSSSCNDTESVMRVKYNNIKGYLIKPVPKDLFIEKVRLALRTYAKQEN